MKLSDGEKLILLMLCELYKHGKVKGEIDPGFVQSAIHSGNTWGLHWKYSWIPFESTETPPIVREVLDMLDMWWFVESAYAKLSPTEKKQVEAEVGSLGKDPQYRGFDGNNECEYMNVACFLIEDLERFTSFKSRSHLNSHMPIVEMYQRMVRVFEPIRATIGPRELSTRELIDILNAQIHPSKRRPAA
jgi:uncharacterized protein YfbU (UPF0304 family)